MFAPRKNTVTAAFVALGAVIGSVAGSDASAATKEQVRLMIMEEARNSTVPPALALAVARVESNFRDDVVSKAGARGVMQIMPATARNEFGIGAGKLSDARTNVRLGVRFLEKLHRQYGGSWERALSHYAGGPLQGGKPHGFTRDYVSNILDWQKRFAAAIALVDRGIFVEEQPERVAPERDEPVTQPVTVPFDVPVDVAPEFNEPVQRVDRKTGRRIIRMAALRPGLAGQPIGDRVIRMADNHRHFHDRGIGRHTAVPAKPAGHRYQVNFNRPAFADRVAARPYQGLDVFRAMIRRNSGIDG